MRFCKYGWRVLLLSLAVACATKNGGPVEPASGPMSGYYKVRLELPGVSPAEVTDVRFGGIKAYDIQPDDAGLWVRVQGHPQSGLVDVEVEDGTETQIFEDAFEYLPPRDPRFERVVAIGASLSQGVQNGLPTAQSALVSPPAQVARQLGGYFPLPVFVDPLFPEMTVDDIGPPPECSRPSIQDLVSMSAEDAVEVLLRGFQYGRVDPNLEVHNLAVGGFLLENVVQGPSMEMIGGDLIAQLVYSPFEAPTKPPLDIAIELDPTIIFSTDLYANDAIGPFVSGSGIRLDTLTPIEEFEQNLAEVLLRLSETDAEVFVANMPRPSILPAAAAKRRNLAAQGMAQEADTAIESVDEMTRAYNTILERLAADYPNVHVVDMAGRTAELERDGLAVGQTKLTTQAFGGLLGIDSIHFTDTGYAVFSNLFIESVNETLDTTVPLIDLEAVLENDRGAPAAYAEAGFDGSLCVR